MKILVIILLAAIALEGLFFALWPARMKALIGDSPDSTLRVIGIVELAVVVVLLILTA